MIGIVANYKKAMIPNEKRYIAAEIIKRI